MRVEPRLSPDDRLLRLWQMQREAGIPPEQRRLPVDRGFERDLEILRQVMERT